MTTKTPLYPNAASAPPFLAIVARVIAGTEHGLAGGSLLNFGDAPDWVYDALARADLESLPWAVKRQVERYRLAALRSTLPDAGPDAGAEYSLDAPDLGDFFDPSETL
jgi:hypothetical protein